MAGVAIYMSAEAFKHEFHRDGITTLTHFSMFIWINEKINTGYKQPNGIFFTAIAAIFALQKHICTLEKQFCYF